MRIDPKLCALDDRVGVSDLDVFASRRFGLPGLLHKAQRTPGGFQPLKDRSAARHGLVTGDLP
jgi:hypothetical protein